VHTSHDCHRNCTELTIDGLPNSMFTVNTSKCTHNFDKFRSFQGLYYHQA